ncbi:MAG: DmsC/YnfH family molybdoenzyme membrane anchor subunit [Caldimonas sp.]
MNPAFSVVAFTVLAGAAQGLVVALALAVLAGISMSAEFLSRGLFVAVMLLVGGLGASFMHLGRPERAWRAAMRWRTSWLSREVIILPTFIGLVAIWWMAPHASEAAFLQRVLMPGAAFVLAALLWYCTAMIYACLRFVEEWAHPLTLVNFVLLGLSSGFVLASALAVFAGDSAFLTASGPTAIALTLTAWATRVTAIRRNAGIRHRSTLQTATGVGSSHLLQTSMGMSAGSFNTREFFHHVSRMALQRIRLAAIGLAFMAPLAAMLMAWLGPWSSLWEIAFLLQLPGLIADRWYFFAQAKHPQNLYYQVVS